ncbi:MAG TPA: GSCFA domain-containing protein [Prolixibacteraceae bacterium]|nr:GSCFA domain-containing protein [Prolixibacteraceae bacterium]
MIKFRTEVELPEFKKKMGYRHQSIMIGSCFAENIGTYLQELCFPIMVNPFGILYNPISIANSLNLLLSGKKFAEQDLFYSNGLYNSFSHHSRFSGIDPDSTLLRINTQNNEASGILKNCHHLFITFGTSWVFEHKINKVVVSNCHKLPAATFDRYRLSVSQITETWIPLIDEMSSNNSNLHLIFTVSPIRHLKDGAHENQLSKSTLLLAIDNLISRYGTETISYFPSYELVLDELRDYRFYASDMTHPSEVAISFLQEKFAATILDKEALAVSTELDKILPALKHKSLNIKDKNYISFIENQIEKINQLQIKYPFIDIEKVNKKLHEKIDN